MHIEDLKGYYRQQSKETCISLHRSNEILQIVLLRHAKPITASKRHVTFEEAEELLKAYRESSVHKDFDPPICTKNITDIKIYHSDLNRSRETAQLIFPLENFIHVEDKRLRELDRQNVKIPFKTPYKLHTMLSRILWLAGTMKNIETPGEALRRLKNNAKHLDDLVLDQKLLIVVAHGFHNYFVGSFLKRLGYTRVKSGGNSHLSVNIWAKNSRQDS